MSLNAFDPQKCRERAAEKLAEAANGPQRRERLIEAAEAWLLLAQKLSDLEHLSAAPKGYVAASDLDAY